MKSVGAHFNVLYQIQIYRHQYFHNLSPVLLDKIGSERNLSQEGEKPDKDSVRPLEVVYRYRIYFARVRLLFSCYIQSIPHSSRE